MKKIISIVFILLMVVFGPLAKAEDKTLTIAEKYDITYDRSSEYATGTGRYNSALTSFRDKYPDVMVQHLTTDRTVRLDEIADSGYGIISAIDFDLRAAYEDGLLTDLAAYGRSFGLAGYNRPAGRRRTSLRGTGEDVPMHDRDYIPVHAQDVGCAN